MWKTVKLAPEYEISINGEVRNKKTGLILKDKIDRYGYKTIGLYTNKRKIYPTIHRLIAIAFIPNPENKPQVNHIDGNKLNNSIDNLEWTTPRDNVTHAYKHNLNINALHIELYNIETKETLLFTSIKELGRKLKIAGGNIMPYIKYSYRYPFLNKYIIRITNLDAFEKLHNVKRCGKSWWVYDHLSKKWAFYLSKNMVTYHTGIRADICNAKNVCDKLGYIITDKPYDVTIAVNDREIEKYREYYRSIPYTKQIVSYVLYDYWTKTEYKFDKLKDIVDFLNKDNHIKEKVTLLAVGSALTKVGLDTNNLIRGYGISYYTGSVIKWTKYTESRLLCSKYGWQGKLVYKLTLENEDIKLFHSYHQLGNFLNVNPQTNFSRLSDYEITDLAYPHKIEKLDKILD